MRELPLLALLGMAFGDLLGQGLGAEVSRRSRKKQDHVELFDDGCGQNPIARTP